MSKTWEERRLTITANELLGRRTPAPAAPPPSASPSPAGWAQRKVANAAGWPWREIGGTLALCFIAATVIALILNSGWTLPSLPRRAAAPTVASSPIIIERVVEVEAAPVVIIVTPTAPPQPERVVAPAPTSRTVQVQAQPAAPVQHPTPAPQPTRQAARAAVVAPSPTWTVAPVIEQALTRGCEYQRQTYPQGTVIQGYYTDANGQPRPAVCRVDGWKAVD